MKAKVITWGRVMRFRLGLGSVFVILRSSFVRVDLGSGLGLASKGLGS